MSQEVTNRSSHLFTGKRIEGFFSDLQNILWLDRIGQTIDSSEIYQVFTLDDAYLELQDETYTCASFHKDVDQSHPIWSIAYDLTYDLVIKHGTNYELETGNPVARSIAWDIAGTAYQIITGKHDGFYLTLFKWYQREHWPCGWKGSYPEGKLVVY